MISGEIWIKTCVLIDLREKKDIGSYIFFIFLKKRACAHKKQTIKKMTLNLALVESAFGNERKAGYINFLYKSPAPDKIR